ncbi:YdcF family protein [Alkaliphilus transvaalensis]|uniref:YdcF family protein n=1 Tax=Alkaliphilus transvaalensis TaxID=114628 RepID=UPI00068503CF|nr:YdcF family protein [Alkaliphilus transvaalensis]
MKKIFKVVGVLMVVIISWCVFQYISISSVGEKAKPGEADVIIVLGAAVWPTGPSPALQARVYRSNEIYKEGFSNSFILTGGLGKYPPTEAEAMAKILSNLGIEENALFLEDQATNTRENIKFSKKIMEEQGWETAIIVTDVFHMKRALLLASDYGIKAYGASVKNTHLYSNKLYKFRYTAREVLAISRYYFDAFIK